MVGFTHVFPVDKEATIRVPDNAVRLTANHKSFSNLGILQQYDELMANRKRDFVMTLKTRIASFASSNARRWGFHLFAPSDLAKDLEFGGLCAFVIGDNKANNRKIALRNGLNGDFLATAELAPAGFQEGEQYDFQLTGNYSGVNELNLTLTVTHGTHIATVEATVDSSLYFGSYFGATARIRNGWAVDILDLSIATP